MCPSDCPDTITAVGWDLTSVRGWSSVAVAASRALVLGLLAFAAHAVAPARAGAAPPYPTAVLLVSGFQTESPFSTPAINCKGKEGGEWNPPGPNRTTPGIAPTLKAAGYEVFTAPVNKATGGVTPLPPLCAGPGEQKPTGSMVITSNGATKPNGLALGNLIDFLHDSYGVENLHLVGHSDGGLWSRSAITQNSTYPGVTIPSLTTLGTPHTGSYLADLAIALNGANCDFSNRIEQRICEATVVAADLIVAKLGRVATLELTSGFLTTWNPQQSLGSCPVSAIAGDFVDFHIPFIEYYTPSDGLVGLASAQAKEALGFGGHLIPAPEIDDLRQAGVYDVVHGGSLKALSKNNLLNQPGISDQVADATLLDNGSPCNVPVAAAATGGGGASGAATVGDPDVQRLHAPLYRVVAADRRGRLPRAGDDDFVVTRPGVSVRCGFDRLQPVRLLGDRRLRVHAAASCGQRLIARTGKGKGPAKATMLRTHPKRHLLVRVEGDQARVRLRGRAPASSKVQFRDGGGWESLQLDRKGRTTLPSGEGGLELRVRARGRGGAPADTAQLTVSR